MKGYIHTLTSFLSDWRLLFEAIIINKCFRVSSPCRLLVNVTQSAVVSSVNRCRCIVLKCCFNPSFLSKVLILFNLSLYKHTLHTTLFSRKAVWTTLSAILSRKMDNCNNVIWLFGRGSLHILPRAAHSLRLWRGSKPVSPNQSPVEYCLCEGEWMCWLASIEGLSMISLIFPL